VSGIEGGADAAQPLPETAAPVPLASRGVQVLIWRMIASAGALAANVLISRGLGPQGRGAYSLYTTTAITLMALGKLGLDQANVYFRTTRGISTERLLAANSTIAFAVGSLCVAVMAFLPKLLPSLFGDTSPALLVLAGLIVPLTIHTQFVASLQMMDGRVLTQFTAAAAGAFAQAMAMLVLGLLHAITLPAVLGVVTAATAVTWIVTVGGPGVRAIFSRWDWPLLREALSHALVLHLGFCFFFLQIRLDVFMLKGLADLATVGHYSIALTLAETMQLATDSVAIALVPRQIGNSLSESATVALRGARMNFLVGLCLAAGWAIAGYPLIVLFFGPQFAPAFGPLVALLPGLLLLGMQRVCSVAVLRSGNTWLISGIYGTALVAKLLLNFWLIPWWGAIGAGIASSLTYVLSAVLFLVWTVRLAQVPAHTMLPQRADIALFASALWGLVRHLGKSAPKA